MRSRSDSSLRDVSSAAMPASASLAIPVVTSAGTSASTSYSEADSLSRDRSTEDYGYISMEPSAEPQRVVVIGAGVGGCFSALELAEVKNPDGTPKYSITLIEKQPEVLRGSSDKTPGRAGLGFHYVHIPTALMYLRETVAFQRKFGAVRDFRVGATLPEHAPVRHGRYVITKDSKPSKEEILRTYSAIQAEYQRLVDLDPANAVFGPPKNLFRVLDPSEYQQHVNMDKADICVETAEHLLDWPEFRKYIIDKLEQCPNIKIRTGVSVNEIKTAATDASLPSPYMVMAARASREESHPANFVINCTWENIRQLNATAKLTSPQVRSNRLKALIFVKLPESLREMNSYFFCMGPHAMFSNLGNGVAAMTYAPDTSMDTSTDEVVPERIQRFLNGSATLDEKSRKAKAILAGVAQYIPGIAHAEIIDVYFGIVQTNGTVDIFDHKSQFNQRDYSGITVEDWGFISNACMKLMYGPENGVTVKEIVEGMKVELDALHKLFESRKKRLVDLAAHSDPQLPNDYNYFRMSVGELKPHALPRPAVRAQLRFFDKGLLKKVETAKTHAVVVDNNVDSKSKPILPRRSRPGS